MSTAVRGLRDEGKYNGKIRFYIVDVGSKKIRDQIATWPGLGSHGLVGTTAARELKVMIPGHEFGAAAVRAKAEDLLKATSPPS